MYYCVPEDQLYLESMLFNHDSSQSTNVHGTHVWLSGNSLIITHIHLSYKDISPNPCPYWLAMTAVCAAHLKK